MNTTNTGEIDRLTGLLQEIATLGERFVLSCENIAASLAGINETYKRQIGRQYPERAEKVRDAVLSRVPTEEDRIREAQGASSEPYQQWVVLEADEDEGEEPGTREREWLEAHKRHAGAQEFN